MTSKKPVDTAAECRELMLTLAPLSAPMSVVVAAVESVRRGAAASVTHVLRVTADNPARREFFVTLRDTRGTRTRAALKTAGFEYAGRNTFVWTSWHHT